MKGRVRLKAKLLNLMCSAILFLGSVKSQASEASFTRGKLKIQNKTLKVEIAETLEQQQRGLMYRKTLSDDEGMIFIYKNEQFLSFWMKNTFVPLSIGFFDKSKKLFQIEDMLPASSEMQTQLPSYQSRRPAQYALEVPKGWFQRHHISMGSVFDLKPDKSPARRP